jgi:hypothetical protein
MSESNIEKQKENKPPYSKQFLIIPQKAYHLSSSETPTSASSSTSTIITEHFIEEIEIDLSETSNSLSHSSSFQHDIAALPWSLLKNISIKDEFITSEIRPKVAIASVAFSIVPSSMLAVICLGASKETCYDATLVFTFTNNERKSYRINSSVPLLINNVFNYNLSHRHINITNNEIDSEVFYAQHLATMNSFHLTSWTETYNPLRFFCGDSAKDIGIEKKEIPIYHECQYIVHLLNNFIPEENRIDPHSIHSPQELYVWLQKTYQKLYY